MDEPRFPWDLRSEKRCGIETGASGLTPNIRLADGLPPVANNDLNNLSGALIATGLNFKANRVQQFNLTLERQIGNNVVSVGFA